MSDAIKKWGTITVVSAAAAFCTYELLQYARVGRPAKLGAGMVTDLFIYPIKSCGGIRVSSAECTPLGLKDGLLRDRHWVVADTQGVAFTQFRKPKLASVRVERSAGYLHITAPDMTTTLKVPIAIPVDATATALCGHNSERKIPSFDCGQEAADWFSNLTNTEARLYASPETWAKVATKVENINRQVDERRQDSQVAYSNGYPYVIVSESSLDDLRTRVPDKLVMAQFRPNIVVSGTRPYEEDAWRKISVGEVELYNELGCSRCPIITIDTVTGVMNPTKEPLKTLKSYRVFENVHKVKPCFGIKMVLEKEGTLTVGDPVRVKSVSK